MLLKKSKLTGYAKTLQDNKKFPVQPSLLWNQRENKHTPTPYLVIPHYPKDSGTRPLDKTHDPVLCSAIEIVDSLTNNIVNDPVLGQTYHVQCRVRNLGAVGCYSGIAEFYSAESSRFDALLSGAMVRPAPLGYNSFMTPASKESIVTLRTLWKFTPQTSAILVRVYDPIVDMLGASYNYATDRHVARRDFLMLDQVHFPKWDGAGVNIQTENHVSQTFTPSLPRLLAVEVAMGTMNKGRGGDAITMTIFDGGKTLFSGVKNMEEGFDGIIRFEIKPSISVVVGRPLTIELHDTGKLVFCWKYASGNRYDKGDGYFYGKKFDTNDFYFKTYGKQ